MNMNDFGGGALGVCMCSLQVARECGELLPGKVTWGRVVQVLQDTAVSCADRPQLCVLCVYDTVYAMNEAVKPII